MRCGHCGTEINAGYSTCPACGAVYRRRPGFLAEFPAYFGWALIAAGVLFAVSEPDYRTAGVVMVLAGVASIAFGRGIRRATPFRWYRRQP